MKDIIAIINQKGGVGKSTTAFALGSGLTLKGNKVLYIDLDSQGNLTHTIAAIANGFTSIDFLTNRAEFKHVLQKIGQKHIIPSGPDLAGADTIINKTGKEYRLKEVIDPIKNLYDYIVIDTPPALGILTINALTAANSIVIPAQADIYSLQGVAQLHATIETVRKYCNKDLKVKGILLTRYSPRSILSRDITEAMEKTAQTLNTQLFKTTIREAVAIKESQVNQEDIYSYAPKSKAALDYMNFIDEFLGDK